MDKVTISLEWMQEIYQGWFVSYNISILSSPVTHTTVTMINSVRANITVPYNTPYNVSVVADLCGRQATTFIGNNYGELSGYVQSHT